MGAPKGRPKPEGSGRKKGNANKITADIRAKLADAFQRGTDAMIKLLEDDATDARVRVEIWKTIGKKTLPDLTATTLNPDTDGKAAPLVINIQPPSHDSNGNPL